MRLLRFIRIAWAMSSRLPWVEDAEWEADDINALRKFLVSKQGRKFRSLLLNMVLRQNALVAAQTDRNKLQHEAGFANGMRMTVHTVESLAREIEPVDELSSDVFGVGRSMSEDPTARRAF